MKRLISLILLISLYICSSKGQNLFNVSPSLLAFHGHYLCADYLSIEEDYWIDLLTEYNIPAVSINPMLYQGRMSFHYSKLYTHLAIGYSFTQESSDSLYKSTLNQFFISPGVGINLYASKLLIVSAYGALRYSRYRHVSSLVNYKINFNEYMNSREIDLRLNNYSASVGINAVFVINKIFSCGFYIAYNMNFHKQSILKTSHNTIVAIPANPFQNLNFGFGFGFGFTSIGNESDIVMPD